MKALKVLREVKGISQRRLALLAKLSYKSLQLIESGGHDPKISTLQQIANGLGYPPHIVEERVATLFELPPDSIAVISARIAEEGENSWKIWLFNFVDAFRVAKKEEYVRTPPVEKTPQKVKALLASTAEMLCEELQIEKPLWCEAIPALDIPWFVAGVENLKAMGLVESPAHFRKRNIFVLNNFLERK